jgi:hypothetical protein
MMMSHYSTATRPTRKRSLAVKTAATIASPCMAHLPSQVRFPVAEGATVVHEGGLGTGCRGFNRPSSWRDKTRRNACLFARFDPGTSLWYNFSVIVATATTRIRAHSSAAERPAHNRLVLGSNPGGPTAGVVGGNIGQLGSQLAGLVFSYRPSKTASLSTTSPWRGYFPIPCLCGKMTYGKDQFLPSLCMRPS